jgi:alpha-methylacyl-CoA racemase
LNFVALAGLFEVDQPEAFRSQQAQEPRAESQELSFASGLPPSALRHDPGRESPLRVPGLLVADIGGAWAAVAGIAAALFHRERTGEGSSVDISIHDVAASWLTFPAAARMIGRAGGAGGAGGEDPPFPIVSDEACYNIYTTADGRHVALAAIEPKFWHLFCERVGRPDFMRQQFVPGVQNRLREQVSEVFKSRTLADWMALFADTDVCLTRINTIREALADPQLRSRGTLVEHEGSQYLRSPIVFRTADHSLGGDDRGAVTSARALGADTDRILRDLGLDDQELADLRSRHVI